MLVVCTANVCRSPTTALLLQRRLDAEGLRPLARLRTAGTGTVPGAGYCPVVAQEVGGAAGGLLSRHASRALTVPLLEQADLVLVMERGHRGLVASMAPSTAARTFTLREAAALATSLVHRGTGAGPPAPREVPGVLDERPPDLRGFVRALHGARGTVHPGPHPRTLAELVRRADVVDPLDVPDAHVRSVTSHRQVLSLLEEGVTGLVDGLLRARWAA